MNNTTERRLQSALQVTDRPPTHHKTESILLSDRASAEEAFIAIVKACLEYLGSNLPATRAGQVEGVHQMRVALRRLRSCLRVFRPLIPKEASADLIAEIRCLNGFLGPARDWGVFMEEGLNPICARFPARRRLKTLHRQAEAIRQAHYQALHRCLDDPRYHRLILRLYSWLAVKPWRQGMSETQQEGLDQPIVNFATPILKQAHRRVVKRGKIFAELDTEDRHALRIRIKRLRYALEFFSSLYPGQSVRAYRNALTRLQDTLGVLNDIAAVDRLLDEANLRPAAPTRQLIEGWYACKLDIYEQRFPKTWKRFRGCKRPWK
jgi:CHAD domain-containing protein